MGSGKEGSFIDDYENVVNSLTIQYLPAYLVKELSDKRAFGLQKYGKISFQSSRENAIAVDTVQHGLEERIDYMNYTLHEMYKHSQLDPDPTKYAQDAARLVLANQLYKLTMQMKEGNNARRLPG